MRKQITIFAENSEIIDLIVEYLYFKKVLKNILHKDDKSDPPFVIILSKLEKKQINKILASRFYNSYQLR